MAAIGRVWAIARMTLLEASRRKVFTILLLFAAALLSSVLFFPSVEIEGRLRLIEIWALRASAVFTAIVGLFLAGFSLPQDFETKRIYMVVTKPISKPLVFLGRYLGYALLLAVFILRPQPVAAVGTIGDSACGAHHLYVNPQRDAQSCTLGCVARGARFVLIVEGTVYEIQNQQFPDLASFADRRVEVSGRIDGTRINVATMSLARP